MINTIIGTIAGVILGIILAKLHSTYYSNIVIEETTNTVENTDLITVMVADPENLINSLEQDLKWHNNEEEVLLNTLEV